jgi:hypothetical protein
MSTAITNYTQQPVQEQDDFSRSLAEIEQTQRMAAALMRTPHYAKIGEVGVFTIVQKAKSIGIPVLDALNGSMYFVNGKVELSANAMNYMIRSKGHSITKDAKSTPLVCILHGKRIDNGDTWIASFSIEEAKRAGIYKNTWEKYPEDMLFARALTRLARQLFPDVIKGCYVEGEIRDAVDAEWVEKSQDKARHVEVQQIAQQAPQAPRITIEQVQILDDLIAEDKELRGTVLDLLKKHGASTLAEIPAPLYQRVYQYCYEYDCKKQLAKAPIIEAPAPSVFDKE